MSSKGFFDDKELPLPCPKCENKTTATLGWIKAHDEFTCASCGAVVAFDKDEAMREIADLEAELRKLTNR